MGDLIVIENTGIEVIEVAPKMEITPEFNTYLGQVNSSAASAASSASIATTQADRAEDEADRAATFVGGNWPLPHSHVTGPIAVDPTFQRLSDAYDAWLKRYGYNQRRWNQSGTLIEEGTTNLLPAGAEDFVTGWIAPAGESVVVTDYPVNIPGVGNVVAKRITGNGLGTSITKMTATPITFSSGLAYRGSLWGMSLSGNARFYIGNGGWVSIGATIQRLVASYTGADLTYPAFTIGVNAITDILDIVVYAPQIENKPYATSYTPPGTTRAAESLTVPASVLNPSAGTIEFDFIASVVYNSARFLSLQDDAATNQILLYNSSDRLMMQTRSNGGGYTYTGTSALLSALTKYRVGITWVNGGKLFLWFNGVKIATGADYATLTAITKLFFGATITATNQANANFSNLRISNIARTDTEMAYTGKLLPDEYTTYYSDMKESISSRPYFKDNLGNALTLQPVNTVPATASYNASGQPTSIRAAGITHTITYNTDGSVNTIYDGIYTRTCNYSAGNLISIT